MYFKESTKECVDKCDSHYYGNTSDSKVMLFYQFKINFSVINAMNLAMNAMELILMNAFLAIIHEIKCILKKALRNA